MTVDCVSEGRTLTAAVRGELDHHRAKEVMTELDEQIDMALPRRLTLDLSGLSFTDSSGIAVLIRVSRRMEQIKGELIVRGFDPSFGTQFSTYAVPKIAGEIRRFLRDDGTVKVSRGMKERGAAVWGARRRLVAEMGREPTLSELAAETGLTPEEIAAAETASDAVASLQAETGEGGLTLEGMLGTGGMEEDVVERLTLRSAMEELPERERQVLLLRYYKNLTQIQCARVLGVSQVQISRLERRAVDRLRKILCEEEVF